LGLPHSLSAELTDRYLPRAVHRAAGHPSALAGRFGPRPGQARALAALGLDGAVASLTRPSGPAVLSGAPPRNAQGQPLHPINVWGDDHCWWLDRMVRSDQQLVERMTLIWHSWFATPIAVSNAELMLGHNRMMRARALG
jgi:hypothetical protein